MSDDIVERLRKVAAAAASRTNGDPKGGRIAIISIPAKDTDVDIMCSETADEIERLRAALREIADTRSDRAYVLRGIARRALDPDQPTTDEG